MRNSPVKRTAVLQAKDRYRNALHATPPTERGRRKVLMADKFLVEERERLAKEEEDARLLAQKQRLRDKRRVESKLLLKQVCPLFSWLTEQERIAVVRRAEEESRRRADAARLLAEQVQERRRHSAIVKDLYESFVIEERRVAQTLLNKQTTDLLSWLLEQERFANKQRLEKYIEKRRMERMRHEAEASKKAEQSLLCGQVKRLIFWLLEQERIVEPRRRHAHLAMERRTTCLLSWLQEHQRVAEEQRREAELRDDAKEANLIEESRRREEKRCKQGLVLLDAMSRLMRCELPQVSQEHRRAKEVLAHNEEHRFNGEDCLDGDASKENDQTRPVDQNGCNGCGRCPVDKTPSQKEPTTGSPSPPGQDSRSPCTTKVAEASRLEVPFKTGDSDEPQGCTHSEAAVGTPLTPPTTSDMSAVVSEMRAVKERKRTASMRAKDRYRNALHASLPTERGRRKVVMTDKFRQDERVRLASEAEDARLAAENQRIRSKRRAESKLVLKQISHLFSWLNEQERIAAVRRAEEESRRRAEVASLLAEEVQAKRRTESNLLLDQTSSLLFWLWLMEREKVVESCHFEGNKCEAEAAKSSKDAARLGTAPVHVEASIASPRSFGFVNSNKDEENTALVDDLIQTNDMQDQEDCSQDLGPIATPLESPVEAMPTVSSPDSNNKSGMSIAPPDLNLPLFFTPKKSPVLGKELSTPTTASTLHSGFDSSLSYSSDEEDSWRDQLDRDGSVRSTRKCYVRHDVARLDVFANGTHCHKESAWASKGKCAGLKIGTFPGTGLCDVQTPSHMVVANGTRRHKASTSARIGKYAGIKVGDIVGLELCDLQAPVEPKVEGNEVPSFAPAACASGEESTHHVPTLCAASEESVCTSESSGQETQVQSPSMIKNRPESRLENELHVACIAAAEQQEADRVRKLAVGGTAAVATIGVIASVAGMVISSKQ